MWTELWRVPWSSCKSLKIYLTIDQAETGLKLKHKRNRMRIKKYQATVPLTRIIYLIVREVWLETALQLSHQLYRKQVLQRGALTHTVHQCLSVLCLSWYLSVFYNSQCTLYIFIHTFFFKYKVYNSIVSVDSCWVSVSASALMNSMFSSLHNASFCLSVCEVQPLPFRVHVNHLRLVWLSPVCLAVCLSVSVRACLPACLLHGCLPVTACLPVCLPSCLPASCLSTLSVFLCVCLPACLPACLPVCEVLPLPWRCPCSSCLTVCLTVCLSVWLSACMSVCLSVCLSVCEVVPLPWRCPCFSCRPAWRWGRGSPPPLRTG